MAISASITRSGIQLTRYNNTSVGSVAYVYQIGNTKSRPASTLWEICDNSGAKSYQIVPVSSLGQSLAACVLLWKALAF